MFVSLWFMFQLPLYPGFIWLFFIFISKLLISFSYQPTQYGAFIILHILLQPGQYNVSQWKISDMWGFVRLYFSEETARLRTAKNRNLIITGFKLDLIWIGWIQLWYKIETFDLMIFLWHHDYIWLVFSLSSPEFLFDLTWYPTDGCSHTMERRDAS